MKISTFILLLWFTVSCRTAQVVHQNSIDTVFMDRRITTEVEVRIDTVTIELPAIEKQVVRKDSSYLENRYSHSLAYIQDDGLLFHDLYSIPQKIRSSVIAFDKIQTKDSVYVKIQKVMIEVPVKTPIPKWKRILMYLGGLLIAFAVYRVVRLIM